MFHKVGWFYGELCAFLSVERIALQPKLKSNQILLNAKDQQVLIGLLSCKLGRSVLFMIALLSVCRILLDARTCNVYHVTLFILTDCLIRVNNASVE